MAQAEHKQVVAVDREKFFKAITKYEDYPSFVDGCNGVEVERKGPGEARTHYKMNIMRDVNYTLDHKEFPEQGKMEWSLVKSDMLKKNIGRWELTSVGEGKTEVKYSIEIEFNIPVPGFILNQLVKSSIPSMIKSFEKRAKTLA
jgi:ribosome-associated toxin RatA of RatAB toxin-antitoxin module